MRCKGLQQNPWPFSCEHKILLNKTNAGWTRDLTDSRVCRHCHCHRRMIYIHNNTTAQQSSLLPDSDSQIVFLFALISKTSPPLLSWSAAENLYSLRNTMQLVFIPPPPHTDIFLTSPPPPIAAHLTTLDSSLYEHSRNYLRSLHVRVCKHGTHGRGSSRQQTYTQFCSMPL